VEISSAFVSVMPSMRGFRRTVTAEVEKSGDDASRGFTRRFGSRVGAEGKRLGSAFGKAFAVGATVAIGAGIGFAKAAISEAADLEQSVGAVQTVFKQSGRQMLTWSKQAATAVGLSRNEFNELGTLIGSQLKNGGTAMDELAPKTNKLIGLGADLSSMFGGTTREAVEALSSALKGERDPIERYGVTLNQAKIDAEATALGFKKVGNSFDTQAQQAATLSLIYKQTADAQGNFNRETDTTAHKQQVLGARFDNLKARIGKGLLPVYNTLLDILEKKVGPITQKVIGGLVGMFDLIVKGDFTKTLRKAFGWTEDAKIVDQILDIRDAIGKALAPVIKKFTDLVRKNPAVVKAFAITLGILAAAIGVVTLATTAFSIALNSTGIPLVILAIAGLVAGLVYAYQHSERFRSVVDKVGQILRSFAAWVRDEVVPVVVDLAQKVATNLQPVWQALVEFFNGSVLPMVAKAVAKFQEWQPTIQKVAGVVVQLVAKWLEFYSAVWGKVLPVLIKVAGFIVRNALPALFGLAGRIGDVIGFLVSFGRKVADAGRAVGDFARKVNEKITKILQWIGNLPGNVTSALGDVGELLVGAGRQIMNGLWNGLKEVWDDIKDWLGERTKDFPKLKGPPAKDKKLLYGSGQLIMGGLLKGLKNGFGSVESILTRITDRLSNFIDKKKVGKKLAGRMQGVIAQISEAARGLQDALAARNDLASSVASGLMGEFNLSEIFGKNQFGLSLGLDSAVQVAQSIVARMRAFAQKLTALVGAGLPPGLVQEVAGLGSVEGSRVADAFLQGGSFLQSQFTSAYNDLQAITQGAGFTVANATHGGEIQRASETLALAIRDGLSELGLEVHVGVDAETSLKIVQKGEKRKKKRK
jgi:hypothetical protein